MRWDALLGFLSFFAVVSVIHAGLNLLQPEPKLGPAVLALVLVIAAVSVWRMRRG